MPAPRAHVFSTCARGAGIHGDVLNVYTVKGEGERVGRGFQRVTHHTPQPTTPHGDRQRETETRREDETKEKKTEKTRQQ